MSRFRCRLTNDMPKAPSGAESDQNMSQSLWHSPCAFLDHTKDHAWMCPGARVWTQKHIRGSGARQSDHDSPSHCHQYTTIWELPAENMQLSMQELPEQKLQSTTYETPLRSGVQSQHCHRSSKCLQAQRLLAGEFLGALLALSLIGSRSRGMGMEAIILSRAACIATYHGTVAPWSKSLSRLHSRTSRR